LVKLLGDVGGVIEVLVVIIGVLVFPYSVISYQIKLIQEIFLIRTADSGLEKDLHKKKQFKISQAL
jgi:hypothetical protein